MDACKICDALPQFAKHIHQYPDPQISTYTNNPLVRALGPITNDDDVVRRLQVEANLPANVRDLPSRIRIHELGIALKRIYIPTTMAVGIQRALEQMLYQGYLGRNPIWPTFNQEVTKRTAKFAQDSELACSEESISSTLLIRGLPGMGKSRVIQRCLSLYRPVMYHSEFEGQPFSFQQRVAVKLDCPPDGSVRGLGLQFLQELDRLFVTRNGNQTKYYERYRKYTKNELLPIMAILALRHGVGLLIVDEIQNLLDAMVDGPGIMLNFLVTLENTIGIPVILVGTYAADDIVLSRYHQVRRANGEGHFEWCPMPCDEEWDAFVKVLWTCQVVRKPARWTREFSNALHAVSFGVTDLALRVFRFAQEEAIDEETEVLTAELFEHTARKHCPLSGPILAALQAQEWSHPALEDLNDVLPHERRKDFKSGGGTAISARNAEDDMAGTSHQANQSKCDNQGHRSLGQKQSSDSMKQHRPSKRAQSRKSCKGTPLHIEQVIQAARAENRSASDALKLNELLAQPSGPSAEGCHASRPSKKRTTTSPDSPKAQGKP